MPEPGPVEAKDLEPQGAPLVELIEFCGRVTALAGIPETQAVAHIEGERYLKAKLARESEVSPGKMEEPFLEDALDGLRRIMVVPVASGALRLAKGTETCILATDDGKLSREIEAVAARTNLLTVKREGSQVFAGMLSPETMVRIFVSDNYLGPYLKRVISETAREEKAPEFVLRTSKRLPGMKEKALKRALEDWQGVWERMTG